MKTPTIDSALERLKQGNERFVKDRFGGAGRDRSRRKELAAGQHPFAIVLSCADSRVAPEIAFDAALGDTFARTGRRKHRCRAARETAGIAPPHGLLPWCPEVQERRPTLRRYSSMSNLRSRPAAFMYRTVPKIGRSPHGLS